MIKKSLLTCAALTILAATASASNVERYLLQSEPSEIEAIVEDLGNRDDVVDVKVLFGEQVLVTTTGGDAAAQSSGAIRVFRDRVVAASSVGQVGALKNDELADRPARVVAAPQPKAGRITTDPLNVFQWAYENFGYENGLAGIDTGIHSVTGSGAGTIIAIATTGADATHEDLQNALWVNSNEIAGNGIDDDNNGYVDDVHGPGPMGSGNTMDEVGTGTALTGIIAASRDNAIGIAGIAPGAQVLACNAALPTGQLSVIDIILCIDYVIDQKTNHGQPIDIFVAGFRGYAPFNQMIEPAMRALHEADVLVIATTPMPGPGTVTVDLNITTDSPSTMGFDNILAVGAVHRTGYTAFNVFGTRTIDASLPGTEILTTLPGHTGAVDGTSYTDEDFSMLPAGWTLQGGWQHSASGGVGNSGALRLDVGSGDVFSNDQVVVLPAMDVSAIPGGVPWFSFELRAEGLVNPNPPQIEAWVNLEWYSELDGAWYPVTSNYDFMEGPAWQRITAYLAPHQLSQVNLASLQLRFTAWTTSDHTPMFVVDDFKVGPEPTDLGYGNRYRYFNGTGAAAAIAAAMAAILHEANPALGTAGLKNLLMNSGQDLQAIIDQPQLDLDLTVTNRLAQLWNGAGTGATQCFGQTTNRRVAPQWARLNTSYLAVGQSLRVASVSTDCEGPGVAPVINELEGGRVIAMSDDGTGPDQVGNDGVFAAEWSSSVPVNEVLDVSNDDALNVLALARYEAIEVPFQWRELQEDPQFPSTHFFSPPFALNIGGLPQGNGIETDVGVGSHPGLALDNWFVDGPTGFMVPSLPGTIRNEPTVGPRTGRYQLVPYWSESPLQSPYLGWHIPEPEVQGTAPNREWVIEWSDYSHANCEADKVSMQMVLFENSPDVLLSYKDIAPGCDGAAPGIMMAHNFDSWHLFDIDITTPMSLLLQPVSTGVNNEPTVTAPIPPQTIVHGETLSLDLTAFFDDPDGDALQYFVGRQSPYVSVDSSGMLTAKFPFHQPADVPVTTIEVGAHDGFLATRTTFEVTLDNSSNEPPQLVQAIPNLDGVVGEILAFDLLQYFDDADGDPLEIIELDSSDGMLRIFPGSNRLIVNATFAGQTETRDFLVTDGGFALQFSVSATAVEIADTAPVQIAPIPDQVVRAGEYLRVPLYQYFESVEWNDIYYSQQSGPAMTIVGFDSVLHGVFEESDVAGSPHEVQIRASTSGTNLSVTATFNLTVLPENQPPALVDSNPVAVTQNQSFSLRLADIIQDPESDPVFFVVTGLPSGLQESAAGVVTGTLPSTGQFSFSARATDSLGASVVTPINLAVSAPSSPPPTTPPPQPSGGGGGGGSVDGLLLVFLLLNLAGRARRATTRPARMN